MTTNPRPLLLPALLLAGPLLLGACANGAFGDDDEAADTAGRADVAVSVVEDTTGSQGEATGAAGDAPAGGTTDGGAAADGSADGAAVSAVAAEITGEPAEMSTNLDAPADARGFIALDSAHASTVYEARNDQSDDIRATAGNTLVVIDYQLYWNPGGNFFDEALRLIVDGTPYQPVHHINELGSIGEVLNWSVVFEVPEGLTGARLEAGLPEGTAGGSTATFDLRFDSSIPLEAPATGLVTPAEGTVEGAPAPAALTANYSGGRATVSVDGASVTDRSGEVFAQAGNKLVVAEMTLVGLQGGGGNVNSTAFRLKADDEWYSTSVFINDIIDFGDTFSYSVVFEVPLDTSEFLLEVGAPKSWIETVPGYGYERSDEPTATFNLVF